MSAGVFPFRFRGKILKLSSSLSFPQSIYDLSCLLGSSDDKQEPDLSSRLQMQATCYGLKRNYLRFQGLEKISLAASIGQELTFCLTVLLWVWLGQGSV